VSCGSDPVLLTSGRLLTRPGYRWGAVLLSGQLRHARVTSIFPTGDGGLVGLERGEWGGGLQRIDRRTGAVTTVESNASGELCGGPLNSDCDPVTAMVASPFGRDCVIAAVGLLHLTSHGRLVEVCGASVRRLFARPYGEQRPWRGHKMNEPFPS